MLPITPQAAAILATAVRAPKVYMVCQLPAITNSLFNNIDPSKLGSQFIVDNVISFKRTCILETGSDSIDFSIDNTNGIMSPLNNNSLMGRYFYPGAIDNKWLAYIGIANGSSETIFPKGVFIAETVPQQNEGGSNTISVSGLDSFGIAFKGEVYTQLPPQLIGKQSNSMYNPGYNLTNPSGDLVTWVCDAKNWMTSAAQNPVYASDFIPIAVYVGSPGSPSNSAVSPSLYTVNAPAGTVVFTTTQAANAVVSVDARPLSISPEFAIKRLCVDYGNWDPAFLKLNPTGVQLPVMAVALDQQLLDVLNEICYMTAPRGQRWRIWIDENGFINFTEGAVDANPVKTFYDTVDLLKIRPEFTVRDMANVVRATGVLQSNQSIDIISYDARSISIFGQKPTYNIPTEYTCTISGMDSGAAAAFFSGLTASFLIELSTPTINVEVDILPDPSLQVNDPVQITDTNTMLNQYFYIKQIDDVITGDDWKQTLRLSQLKLSQDYQFGLQQTTGAPTSINPNAVSAQTGIIQAVALQDSIHPQTFLVQNSEAAVDSTFTPILYMWDGSPLITTITVNAPAAGVFYIWRFMYIAEDAYTVTGKLTGSGNSDVNSAIFFFPTYDNTNNFDTPQARKSYWPLLRTTDWITNDGVTSYATQTTFTSTYTHGPGCDTSHYWPYGNLRVAQTDYFGDTTGGFVGAQLYAAGTPSATILGANSTTRFGVDFGTTYTPSVPVFYGVHRKATPCYLCILVATTGGAIQFKRIPFYIGTV